MRLLESIRFIKVLLAITMIKRRAPLLLIGFFSFIAVWILLSLLVLVLMAVTDTESESEDRVAPVAIPNQTEDVDAVDVVKLPAATLSVNIVNEISATPTIDALNLQTLLLEVEGVATVRVIDIRGFAAGWLAFLEVDTDADYMTEATADAIREITFTAIGEERIQFSVILWDRVNKAINFTWDNGTQIWLTTTLVSDPG